MANRGRLAAVVAVFSVLAMLAGCGASPSRTTPRPAADPIAYVALGDSYTAAPYVPTTDVAGGCFRSDHDYPSLLADSIGARLTDVSCVGATSADVTGRQQVSGQNSVPPQMRALSADTDLVTVGLGGNDGGLFGTLVGSCPLTGPTVGPTRRGSTCQAPDEAWVSRTLVATRATLTRMLHVVRDRAPKATVLLVGYPSLVSGTTCADLPLAPGAGPKFARVVAQLRDTQRAAAKAAGVGFVDVFAASRGHEICSAEPWVNGVHTDTHRALAVHPLAAGQQAVADLLRSRLPDDLRKRIVP